MHQTFYIDIDEEITSIVERLRNAKSNEVIVVVPKRALLIQSIVNLRLLKKEADAMGVSISIVTQDNLGKVLVEKAGISYQERLDEIRDDEIVSTSDKVGGGYFNKDEYKEMGTNFSDQKNDRLDKIGSDSYFSNAASATKKDAKVDLQSAANSVSGGAQPSPVSNEKILNKELVSGIGDDIKRKSPVGMDVVSPVASGLNKETKKTGDYLASQKSLEMLQPQSNASYGGSGDKKIDNFFQHSNYPNYAEPVKSNGDFKDAKLSHKIKKAFWAFGIIVILIIVGAAAYIFIPKATVLISVKYSEKSQDIEVKGDVNAQEIDYDNETIPIKLVSETIEVSKSVTSSGSKSANSQKAKGTITVYNEFSSASQSLVATTRFESENGKIFRIEKGITIPGTTTVGSEVKPGVVEVEVVADEAGEEYNIDAGKFTIPGFKNNGNDKYNKIYAKSTKTMTGGGSGSNTADQKKVITDTDIANAKSAILKDLNAEIKDKLKASAGEGAVVLDEAINSEEATYNLSNSVGEAVDNFEIKGQIKASALVFSEADLKNITGRIMSKSGNGKTSIDGSLITLAYGKASPDFKAGTVVIKARGTNKTGTDIDLEDIKKGILGKSNDDLKTYLEAYPDIEKVDVTYWPPFMNNKIPSYEKRVEVDIDKGIDK